MKIGKIMAAAIVLAGLALSAEAAGTLMEQKAVIGGRVESIVEEGAAVVEGDVLAEVGTLAGPVPAAKAAGDGTVREVRAEKGQTIARGDVVAVLEAAE